MATERGAAADPGDRPVNPGKKLLTRRRMLGGAAVVAGLGAAGYAAWRRFRGSDAEVLARGRVARTADAWPVFARDERFVYGRPETNEADAARYTNFYEFSLFKWTWRYMEAFNTSPWTVQIGGLCRNQETIDVDALVARHAKDLCERQYRHRCVETWAMTVPWIGIPLAAVVRAADPLATARYVRFVSFDRPEEAPGMRGDFGFPWPYTEGLRLDEAMNELPLLAVGMYGHPLLKQHGAPIRLVVPWKYGYKSIKSIERIDFLKRRPETFWNSVAPGSYPFVSNVDPSVARPWSQRTEKMLGTGEQYATERFNGYGEHVASLYSR